jgi:hypothetical protein
VLLLPASFSPLLLVESLVLVVLEDPWSPSGITQLPAQFGRSFLWLGVRFSSRCFEISQKILPLCVPIRSYVPSPFEFWILAYSYSFFGASHWFVSFYSSTKFLCARDYISWSTLTFNLYSALDGIHVKTNWMWSKSFNDVCPTISSIHSMLGFMYTIARAWGIGRTRSHSSTYTLSLVCRIVQSMPLFLLSI